MSSIELDDEMVKKDAHDARHFFRGFLTAGIGGPALIIGVFAIAVIGLAISHYG